MDKLTPKQRRFVDEYLNERAQFGSITTVFAEVGVAEFVRIQRTAEAER
jgi:hypothetical protein